jgi:phosphomannomutase
VNVVRRGAAGVVAIRSMMESLRAAPPRDLGGDEVIALSDYLAGVRTEVRSRLPRPLGLPRSDVLAFELASGSRVIARPSGTEPKAKFYFDVREDVARGEPVAGARERALAHMKRIAAAFEGALGPLA